MRETNLLEFVGALKKTFRCKRVRACFWKGKLVFICGDKLLVVSTLKGGDGNENKRNSGE